MAESKSLLSPLCYWSAQNCHSELLSKNQPTPVSSTIFSASVIRKIGHCYLSVLMIHYADKQPRTSLWEAKMNENALYAPKAYLIVGVKFMVLAHI